MATIGITTMEEPMLSRLDRLDIIVKQLEEMRGGYHSPKSSTASTTSTEGQASSSTDFSPKSLEKHCRPIDDVILETELKGTLIERLVHVEDRVLKLEEEVETQKKKEEVNSAAEKSPSKGLKQLVKSCVKSKRKDKAKH